MNFFTSMQFVAGIVISVIIMFDSSLNFYIMTEDKDMHRPNPDPNKRVTINENAGNNGGEQQPAGDEALKGNTGAGGSGAEPENKEASDKSEESWEGHDSDGNTGIMTNDDLEKDEVGGGGSSLRDEGSPGSAN